MKPTAPLTLALLMPCIAAAGLPEPVLPATVGVNIHFTRGREKDLDLIAAAGFRVVRMDFTWQGIERQKGAYDWSAYDELTAGLERRGIRPYYILDYSHQLYEDLVTIKAPPYNKEVQSPAAPRKPESVAAFAKWAGEAAKRYRGRNVIWEIWNEPNIKFWKPEPNVTNYTALALATCRSVRAADPDATIVAPGSSGFPWPFLEEFFRAGALEHLTAVSVHPYRDYRKGPETAGDDYARLRELIDKYAPASRKGNIPILSGEWGYATHDKGVSPDTQAAFLVRQQLFNLHEKIPVSIWYDWKNDGTDPAEREHNFGTVTHDLQPKPAYTAIATLTTALQGSKFVRRIKTSSEADWVLLLADAKGTHHLAAWTTGSPHETTIPLLGDAPAAFPRTYGMGDVSRIHATDGCLTLSLAQLPQYIRLGDTQPE